MYEDSAEAADFEPFSADFYLNVEWPTDYWTDVEGRASVKQASRMTAALIRAEGTSHTHAYVEEDQTSAFARAVGDSAFFVEFDLTSAAAVSLSGDTPWVRTTVDPPREVLVRVALERGATTLFSHVREYVYPSGVTQDDGDEFSFVDTLPAGSYVLEIVALTETRSQGPWRQYAEATAIYDTTMTLSAPGDLNNDGDIDMSDHGVFVDCMAGPGVSVPPPGCAPSEFLLADLEADGDVDLADYAAFEHTFPDQ